MNSTSRALIACLLCACAGSNDADDADRADVDVDEIAVDELESALAEAYCAQLFGPAPCCTADELRPPPPELGIFVPNSMEEITDVASCIEVYRRDGVFPDHVVTAVKEGRLEYDAKAAADCVATIASSCEFADDVRLTFGTLNDGFIGGPLPSFCAGVVTPSGTMCRRDFDCAAGTFCDGEGASTVGECRSLPEAGQRCGDFADGAGKCAEGLVCHRPTPTMQVCEPKLPDGEPCFLDDFCLSGRCQRNDGDLDDGLCAAAEPFCDGGSTAG